MTTWTYNDHVGHPDPPHQPLYLEPMLRVLRMHGQGRNLLDAGCGDGNFSASLAAAGYRVSGVDMSPAGIEVARGRGVGRFATASLYDDFTSVFEGVPHFDAIVSVEVIEHLYDPRRFVRRANEALVPGGLLILTTPYWGYVKNLALAVTNRTDRALTALWDGGHIKHWSRKTITQLGVEAGFVPVDFHGAGRRYAPGLWNGMMITFRRPGGAGWSLSGEGAGWGTGDEPGHDG